MIPPLHRARRLAACLLAALAAAGAAAADTPPCDAVDGLVPVCGFVGPEDIVRAPGGRYLVVGQMGDPGGLVLVDTQAPGASAVTPAIAPADGWGDPACPPPESALHLHGLDLSRRGDDRWQLLAVNHAGRESVEFFELSPGEPGGEVPPQLAWRGCVEAPPEGYFNDVAALPEGGFVVSHMAPRSAELRSFIFALFGRDTGFVYRWDPATGFSEQPGTASRYPNGVTVSPDGSALYLNEYLADRMRKIDLATGERLGEVAVEKPDNASWAADGRLLIASHHAGLFALLGSLRQPRDEVSLLPFSIIAVDPDTLAKETLFRHEGPPMGAGTVAVDAAGSLWIGSYVGDRVLRVRAP
ncbi:MAG: SMP-30/gluconolactonase/LRE family protein [Pseudohaliea sp.]